VPGNNGAGRHIDRMARFARPVLPGYPYHVIERGDRRQQAFFEDADYVLDRDLLT